MESSVYREILSRGEARGKAIGEARGKAIGATEGRRTLLAKQIGRRLGKTKKATALIKALSSCDVATMDKIAFVVLETPKKDLAATIERLIAKGTQE